MNVIAIDPGKNGGVAVLSGEGEVLVCKKMPDTPADLLELLKEYKEGSCCYLEKVQGIPGQGAASAFSFGRGFGQIEMALMALCIPTYDVTPQKWQKFYQVGGSSIMNSTAAEKREHKNKLKQKAQQLFPKLGKSITLVTCDSLLIALYGVHQQRKK